MAARHDAVVTGSVQIREDTQVFNRLIWAQPDGNFEFYDKRHLFRMANEHHRYASGANRADIGIQRLANLSIGLLRPAVSGVFEKPFFM